jgi:hypothetical protein
MSSGEGFHPISMERHDSVIEAFISAIEEDDVSWRNFDAWQQNGRHGEAPDYTNNVGVITQRYKSLGMPISKIVMLREVAYQIFENAESEQTESSESMV